MVKKITLSGLLLFWAIHTFAFGTKLDSLISLMRHAENDSAKVSYLNKIAFGLSNTEPNQALDYVNRAINISQLNDYKKGLADGYHVKGILMSNMQLYKAAILSYTRALRLRTNIGDKKGMSATLTNLGSVYLKINELNKTIEMYNRSLKIDEELNSLTDIATDYNNLGLVYWQKSSYDSARYYFQKAFYRYQKKGDIGEMASIYSNIGATWFYQGVMEKALYYFKGAYNSYKSVKSYKGMAIALNNMAQILEKMKQYDKALNYRKGALYIWQKLRDSASVAHSYLLIGRHYQLQDKWQKALGFAEKSYLLSDSIASLSDKTAAIKLIYDLQKTMGNEKAASKSYQTYTVLNDSIQNLQKKHANNLQKLSTIFSDTAMASDSIKTVEINSKHKKQAQKMEFYLWIAGGIILLLMVLILFLFYKMKKNRQV